MVTGRIKRTLLILSMVTLMYSCLGKTEQEPTDLKKQTELITAKVFHETNDVQIITSAVPQPWETAELSVQDSAVLIALLVEENNTVKKGDLLAGLLTYNRREGYIPLNLTAPINGIVTRINYKLQDHISGGSRIIELKNFERYTLRIPLASYQLDYLRKNMPVELLLDKARLRAHIYEINRRKKELLVVTEPAPSLMLDEDMFTVKISGRHLAGSYINKRFFKQSDSLSVLLQDSIALKIYAVGQADSLVLIYPPLPDVHFVWIAKEQSVAGITKSAKGGEL